jgi:MoxR-like ATPase
MHSASFDSIEQTRETLGRHQYFAEDALATSIFLALKMGKPLFLEGEPGVGKTDVGRVLSRALDTKLIRLQCFEGLDVTQAVYEWDYPRQLIEVQARSALSMGTARSAADTLDIFDESFLLRRPLLQAIDHGQERAPVLLIDEIDRADEEFESFLLELLSDFQVTIPELGTIRAKHRPVTIVTSNRTREIHDALKRRCIYHWIDFPEFSKELAIVRAKVPGAGEQLSLQIVRFVQELRSEELYKRPGVAETLDWATALMHLDAGRVDEVAVDRTLGLLLKYQDDIDKVRGPVASEVLARARAS